MKRFTVPCAWILGAVAAFAEPRPDVNSITLPTFIFENRHAITAGTAFVLEHEGKSYLTTAYHVLGPPGGLKTRISARQVPQEVRAITALCLGDTRTVLLGTPLLLVDDAKPFDESGGESDVTFAVLAYPAGPRALKLSEAELKAGERVWLFARLVDRDRPTLYPATIKEATAAVVQYTMDDAGLNLRGLSGAPVLREDGTVAGMHLGFGATDDALIGAAAPAAAMRQRLADAVKRASDE